MISSPLYHSKALEFILAGNATFTVKSLKTSTRYTYRVVKSDNDRSVDTVYFVKLLTSPDSYAYMGLLKLTLAGPTFNTTKNSKVGNDAPGFKAFSAVMGYLFKGRTDWKDLEIWHEGQCCRCGRELTVPESIASGIGPECAKRLRIANDLQPVRELAALKLN